jgi:hypothetical protein
MHGYLSATVKGHATKRQESWRKRGRGPVGQTGKPNVAGWTQLAQFFGKGGGTVQVGGERLFN